MSEHTKLEAAWGIVDPNIDPVQWFKDHLSFGKGDIHTIWFPKHPLTAGEHPRPDHAVLLCIVGNGTDSEANAKRVVDLWNEALSAETCPPSNLVRHAEQELRRAGLYDKDSDYGGMLAHAVMKLVKAHVREGHSGMSHAVTLELFNRVANYKTLTPITNLPGEWHEVGKDMMPGGERTCWQNRRNGALFSHDGGKTYYDIDEKQPRFRTLRRLLGLSIFKMHVSAEAAP